MDRIVTAIIVLVIASFVAAVVTGYSPPAAHANGGEHADGGAFEEEPWWHRPLSLAEPPLPHREPFDPAPGYLDHLRRFMALAVDTLKAANPEIKVTTNFGRYPFDEKAIEDGVRLFERLPALDVSGVTIYPDYDSLVMNRIPGIIHEFGRLKRPVEITEIGVCTARHTPEQQRILLGVYFDMLNQIPPSSVYVYELQDHNAASTAIPCESSFGLKDADGTAKPAFAVFLKHVRQFPRLGVTTRILFAEDANLNAETFRRNVDDLAANGVKHVNLTTEWWKVATIDRWGRLRWDERKWETVADSIGYASSKGLVVRLHTSPPWEQGTTIAEYERAVVEYYERIATLPGVGLVQIYNETNQFRFTDYGPVERLF
jgi:hypothetical protein